MDKPKILSGEAIVAKGITRIDVSLPEVGLKDVTPNGSWLEQKQIQAALEARKHLIEVEKIEKFGNISHAIWQEDLQLAEVTQKSGGLWQYLGHNVGKTLYLRPEEALFMMEINSLLLKHNDVTVSLQKAYSLLLKGTTALSQYKVYASLSRLGYRVYRHKVPKINKDIENNSCLTTNTSKSEKMEVQLEIDTTVAENISDQVLTDSSVEFIDSKTNADNYLQKNIENKSSEIQENKTTDKSNENNETQVGNISSHVVDIDKKESNKNLTKENNEQRYVIVDTNMGNSEEVNKASYVIEIDKNESNKNITKENNEQRYVIIDTNMGNSEEVNTFSYVIEIDKNESIKNVTKENNEQRYVIVDKNMGNGDENDSSVEFIDSKTNVNISLQINVENIPVSISERNNSVKENKPSEIRENKTTDECNDNNKTEEVNKASYVIEIDTKESNKNVTEENNEQRYVIVDTNMGNSEEVNESSYVMEIDKNESNKIVTKENNDQRYVIVDKNMGNSEEVNHSSCVMEIDKNESNKNRTSENNEQRFVIFDTNMGKSDENEIISNENEGTETKSNEATETKTNDIEVSMEVDAVAPLLTEKESLVVVDTESIVNEINPAIAENDATNDETATESSVNAENSYFDEVNESQQKPDVMEISEENIVPESTVETNEEVDENKNLRSAIAIEVDNADSDVVLDLDTPKSQESVIDNNKTEINNTRITDYTLPDAILCKRNQLFHNYVTKLKRLTSREYKPSDCKSIDKNFESMPEFFKKEIVTINVPDQQYIPKNVFVNKSSYVLSVKEIKNKSRRSMSVESAPYNSSDEVNGNHVRRIRNTSSVEHTQNSTQNQQDTNNIRFQPRSNYYFRPYYFWRPQNHMNYVHFNMIYQRSYYPSMYYQPRFNYHQRQNPLLRAYSFPNHFQNNPYHNPNNNTRKRMRSAKATHLQSIKNLAVRLKQLIMNGNNEHQNIESLHRLLYAYNTRYKAKLRLTKQFEVINDETIVETIDLEEDDESRKKRPRLSQDSDKFNENLDLLRKLASTLKDLNSKNKVTSKHKRAMSKAIKTFNKSYDAEIYMNSNFEVIDKRHIYITSDSETDCVVKEPEKVYKKKKLRNPFNILKRRSEKQAEASPSTSKDIESNQSKEGDTCNIELTEETNAKYNPRIFKAFDKNWLPGENDFGRAEVVHKNTMNSRFIDAIKDEYLFNFIKDHHEEFNNWLEAKIAYLQHMEETDTEFQNEQDQMMAARESVTHSGLKPLIDTEDGLDVPSVLEKLRIIKNNEEVDTESNLSIDFDVYTRDVQNFKKTNPPKPHFRIICLKASSGVPSNAEVMALHSKYEDNILIVFAIVGTSSISYLQMNPINLPVYVACNDLE